MDRTFLDANMDSIATTIFVLLISLFACAWIIWGYATIYSLKLFYYLRDKHRDRWSQLAWGFGTANPFEWLPYVFNDSDEDDPKIREYKGRIRLGTRRALFVLLLFLLAVILVIIGIVTGLLR